MKGIILIVFVALFFVLYLMQHRYSVIETQQMEKLQKQKQLLQQELILLEGEKTKTFLYSNLEDSASQLNLSFPKNIPSYPSQQYKTVNNNNHSQLTNLNSNEPHKD